MTQAKLISVNIRVVEHPEIVLTRIEYGDTMNNADGTFSAWLESPAPIPVSSTISVEYIYENQTNIDLLVNVGNAQNGRQTVGRICWGATRACKAISSVPSDRDRFFVAFNKLVKSVRRILDEAKKL